ncbi:hypothetical protein BH23GEM4_BH23GEM4_11050 [soil metagenome]
MIVADTNLIAYLLIPGERTEFAQAVLRKDSAWVAPLLWRSEFRNVLALYMRQELFSFPDALQYMEEAEELMRGGEFRVKSPPVLRLAKRSGCAACDCEFAHLAEQLRLPLVTSDQKVLRAFPTTAVSLEAFAE